MYLSKQKPLFFITCVKRSIFIGILSTYSLRCSSLLPQLGGLIMLLFVAVSCWFTPMTNSPCSTHSALWCAGWYLWAVLNNGSHLYSKSWSFKLHFIMEFSLYQYFQPETLEWIIQFTCSTLQYQMLTFTKYHRVTKALYHGVTGWNWRQGLNK